MGLLPLVPRLPRVGASVLLATLGACSTIPPYETLDLRDSATIPSVEVRAPLGSGEEGQRMFLAASAIGAEGSDGGSIDGGQRIEVGGTVIDGPATWDADFELRCVSVLLGADIPLEPVVLEMGIGLASVGAQVDLRSEFVHAKEDLDFGGLALDAALRGPILDWLDWRVSFDVVIGSDSTLTRADALLVARPFGFLRVHAGLGAMQFERTDVGGSDIELGLTGPRLGVTLQF